MSSTIGKDRIWQMTFSFCLANTKVDETFKTTFKKMILNIISVVFERLKCF